MKKLEVLSAIGWCVAGLLAMRMVLHVPAMESRSVVEAIRNRCELPAGTVVFVVREPAADSP